MDAINFHKNYDKKFNAKTSKDGFTTILSHYFYRCSFGFFENTKKFRTYLQRAFKRIHFLGNLNLMLCTKYKEYINDL